MKILYFDIDSLRADHLGCYGYHRRTSPNIDELSKSSSIFDNVYASDVPCLPSRTALLTGRFGIQNGVVNHGELTQSQLERDEVGNFGQDCSWMPYPYE